MEKRELEKRISELELELSNLKRIKDKDDIQHIGEGTELNENNTARMQSESSKLLTQNFLDIIIEHSPNALWISDQYGTMIRMNQACRDVLQLSDEEVVGKYNIFQDNVVEAQGMMPQVRAVFEKGETAHFTVSYETSKVQGLTLKHSVTRFLHVNISPLFDSKGMVTNAIIQHVDITQRKIAEDALIQSEERYRNALQKAERFADIMDNIPSYIYIKDQNRNYVYANQLTLNLFKSTKEKLPYNFDYESFPKHVADKIRVIDDMVLNEGKTTRNEIESSDSNNNPVYYWEIKYPLYNEDGSIWGLCGITIDISDLKRTENALKESEDKLKKLNTDKDRFISILAHDLIGPFSPILGLLNLLSNHIHEYETDKIEEIVTNVHDSAYRVYHLLKETLQWVSAQSGKIPYNPQILSFAEICDEVTETLKPNFTNKNISIKHFSDGNEMVFADKNMFKAILRNLVSNAIKFTHEGGKISIYAEQNPTEVTITVSDNGMGIQPENLSKLLNSSQAYSTSGTDFEKGSGLGLIICKEFVEKHGGRIWIESEYEKGSNFKFTIPNPN